MPFRKKEALHKINEKILVAKVRLVGADIEPDVYSTEKALEMAKERGLDLVMITEKSDPPVCRILEYKKFVYEQKKKQKELKAKQVKVVVKEIRFGPNTDDHDYEFKKNHAIKFLEEGAKLKAYVFFKGRSIIFKDKGEVLLLKLAQDIEKYGKPEQLPKMEGKKMIILFGPKTTKK